MDQKTCYIIGPIGKPDSDNRRWADFVKDRIITPVITECHFQAPQRSDIDHSESMIMTGIVQQMFEANLVIADLTDWNPNVFYELGIRNCAHKPVIHLIKDGQSPPFDLAGNKAIFVSRDHVRVLEAHTEIKERIEAIEKKPEQFYSHVQTYMQGKELHALKEAGTGRDSLIAETLERLVTLAQFNSGRLQRLCNTTAGKAKLSFAETTRAAIEQSQLTTTAPPELDS